MEGDEGEEDGGITLGEEMSAEDCDYESGEEPCDGNMMEVLADREKSWPGSFLAVCDAAQITIKM